LLRAYYGMTQHWLARYLEVPRSTVAMEELSRANLPAGSVLRLQPFFDGLPAPDGTAAEPVAEPTEAGVAAARVRLTERKRECRYQVLRLAQQQERLQVRVRQVRLRLQALPTLLASLAPAPADEQQRQELNQWAADAPAQLRDDEAALTVLDLRQRVLAFELQELETMLTDLAGQP
jgi:hypothetical protein